MSRLTDRRSPARMAMAGVGRRLAVMTVELSAALMLMPAGLAEAQTGSPRPVALTDTDGAFGPGLGVGIEFAALEADGHTEAAPAINAAGDVVFIATLAGDGVTSDNDTGIWVYRHGILSLVAREGNQVPDMSTGVVYSQFGDSSSSSDSTLDPHLSDSGRIAFKAELRGSGIDTLNDGALFTEQDGTVSLVLQERVTELPDHPGVLFGQRSNDGIWGSQPIHMTRDGQVILKISANAYVSGSGFREWATIRETDGVLDTWFYHGDPVPGYPDATFIGALFDTEVSRDGYIADSRLNSEEDLVGFDHALWSDRSGTQEAIYPEGTPQYPEYGGAYLQATNALGRVAIQTRSADGWEAILWSEGMYGIALEIAETGGLAPGTQSVFDLLSVHTVMADSGTLALNTWLEHDAYTNGTNDRGIWINRSGTLLELSLRTGDPVPGRPDLLIADLDQMYINASDRLAVLGTASDSQEVLWLQDDNGDYQLIAKGVDAGNEFDVFGDGSDLRLILDIVTDSKVGSTGDARRNVINDNGDITFRLKFIDGSEGIFVTAAVAGDVDGDGDVDLSDLAQLLAAYGSCIGDAGYDEAADLDDSGCIDLADLATLLANYGTGG